MQAVILAAGKSSRFYPFTNVSHKALVKIMGKTLLEHTIVSIKKSGITDIVIVVTEHNSIQEVLGDGKALGMRITYAIQPEPLGMGDALLRAEKYLHGDFFLTNANHVDFHEFYDQLTSKKRGKEDIVLLGRRQDVIGVYGAMSVNNEKVIGFIEKPTQDSVSSLRHIGIYLLTKGYLDILKKTPLDHNHLEHAIDAYAKLGKVTYIETDRQTVTLKYAWDVLEIKDYLLKQVKHFISPEAFVSKDAIIQGNIFIEKGAKIFEGVCLKGPLYIGKNAVVGNNALLRGGTCIEEHAVAGSYMEMTNTLLMANSTTHSGFIGDSVIGSDCKIGACICTANVRLDRKKVASEVKEIKVESFRKHLGVIIGDNAIIGAGVTTMPGVIIGNDTVVGPSTTVMQNVEDNVKYYTEFKTVIKKHQTI